MTPSAVLAVGVGVAVLACAMSACGEVESSTSDGTDASADAGAPPDAAWQQDPGTLRPDRADCLARPVETCVGNSFFSAADQKCNPAETCTYMKYAMDENGCLIALGAPPGGERDLQECVAGEIAQKRWTCASSVTRLAYFGPCPIR